MASPKYVEGNVRARCPGCDAALSTFLRNVGGKHLGTIIRNEIHNFDGQSYTRILYKLMQCGGCGRGALATIHDNGSGFGILESLYPNAPEMAPLPPGVPPPIEQEYREAELCASVGAWRAASALLRSVLEKTLKANGYVKGKNLEERIDQAADDGIITAARRKRAHEQIRDLGNDILHDEWREVTEGEYGSAHHYAQRILEDFYDDRAGVVELLIKADRLKPDSPK